MIYPAKTHASLEKHIRSIGRHYVAAVITMTLLIGATYQTVEIALERHSLQQDISYLMGRQFIRFQQLANQSRAVMLASANPAIPEYVVEPMVSDVKRAIGDIRIMSGKLRELHERIRRNLLEKLNVPDGAQEEMRVELSARLQEFLDRADRVASTKMQERRQRYSFWGPIDFAVSSDSLLMREFSALIDSEHDRTERSINHASLVSEVLLGLNVATLLLATTILFMPLLAKLRTEHRRTQDYEARVVRLAHTDAVTGLNNRSSFNDALNTLFGSLEHAREGFSILLIDLDRFKAVNDSLGHLAGDAVLRHIARILVKTCRSCDIVARLGGDEFAVLFPGLADPAALQDLAARLTDAVTAECNVDDRSFSITASIGGAVAPHHAIDARALVRVADLALYAAKTKRNTAVIFDDTQLAQRLEEDQLAASLAQAADRDEFLVYYQQKVDLQSGDHIGFEALVRWRHPQLGILAPSRFLSLVEGPHLIRSMTHRVIDTVARDLKAWKTAGLRTGAVAINFPELLLVNREGYDLIAAAVDTYQLDWRDFAVEVTEDVFLNRGSCQILETIAQFRKQGTSVSLDDFGTGFASLVHLRDFPFDELKIDRSFIADLGADGRSEQIVRAMIDLARNLGKRCVAEGIESNTQRDFLLAAGCEVGQGYLFAKPEPRSSASARLPVKDSARRDIDLKAG